MMDHQPDSNGLLFYCTEKWCTEQTEKEDGTNEEIHEICFFPTSTTVNMFFSFFIIGEHKRCTWAVRFYDIFFLAAYVTSQLWNLMENYYYYPRRKLETRINITHVHEFLFAISSAHGTVTMDDWITCNFNKRFVIDFSPIFSSPKAFTSSPFPFISRLIPIPARTMWKE